MDDNNNLNDMIKKAQEMINNNQIPPELQSLVQNFNKRKWAKQS